MKELRVLFLHVIDRIKEAGKTQAVLTKYDESIKTRLGIHEISDETCSRNGLIVLELTGEMSEWDALESDLSKINGLVVKNMKFDI